MQDLRNAIVESPDDTGIENGKCDWVDHKYIFNKIRAYTYHKFYTRYKYVGEYNGL